MADCAAHYSGAMQCLLDDMDRLESAMWFRYEDFVEDPAGTLLRIEKYLHLPTPFDLGRLDHLTVHNIDETPGGVRDFNAKSIARLSRSDVDVINRHASELMQRLGYPLL
jgi:hypothetical protein